MPKQPRAKRLESTLPSVTKPVIAAVLDRPVPTGEYRSAYCPVCSTSHGITRWSRDPKMPEDASLGVIQEVGAGKGHSFRLLGHFGPDDDPDGFHDLVRRRLLSALQKWIALGWLTRDDIISLASSIPSAHDPGQLQQDLTKLD